jgi:peptidoglycan/LPS O-acetylase OafA/YrhL
MAKTIAARIIETKGRTSGFDYLRIGLAVSVIGVHCTSTSYGFEIDRVIWARPQVAFFHMILPMFFALSGFLVAGSLERCPTLVSFYGLRVLRIVPALFVEVVISALIFGPLLSSLDLATYFSAPEFRAYFLNIVGDIHYVLPGVFTHNPIPNTVNQQLWTVPFELECYLALGVLAVIGAVRRRSLLLAVVIAGQTLWAWEAIKRGGDYTAGATGPVLVLCFLIGVLFFLYRDSLSLTLPLFLAALVLSVALILLPRGAYYVPLPATYVTVYLGLLDPPKARGLFSGDYSYGLYLYGFPIQQAFASIGPWAQHWYLNLAFTLALGFTVACLSWHYVEKPALRLRRFLPELERRALALVTPKRKVLVEEATDVGAA